MRADGQSKVPQLHGCLSICVSHFFSLVIDFNEKAETINPLGGILGVSQAGALSITYPEFHQFCSGPLPAGEQETARGHKDPTFLMPQGHPKDRNKIPVSSRPCGSRTK